ncbi:MAG: type II secretion system F family protein [Patescibacteria group bacterium]
MLFIYKAIKDNKRITAKLEADSEGSVMKYLQENDYFPISITKARSKITFFDELFNRITFSDIVDFTRQLAIMLNAGLTLVDALDILKKQIKKPPLQDLITDIDKQIKGGIPFSTILKNYPKYFPNLYISLIKSGEASGKLSDILLRLAENLEKEREFRGKLKGALIYPAIVVSAMIIVMFVMITFVIPRMLTLYSDFDIELPLNTRILLAISTFSSTYWPIIIVVVVGIIISIRVYFKTPVGKKVLDTVVLRIPFISNIVKMAALVDGTRTLSILIGSGVSILDALNIVVETTNNTVYKESFKEVYRKIEKGKSLGNALSTEEVFPPILVQMSIVGENTGHLDETLFRLSKYFEFESESAIKTMTALIEPAVLVLLGIGVAFLVLSVITPIYQLTTAF